MTKEESIGVSGFLYNKETGDKVADFGARPPKHMAKLKDFTMLFHDASEKLARNKNLTGRVLLFAISHVDYQHRITMTQAEIARQLDMKQPVVNRCFKQLVQEQIVEEVDRYGMCKIYRVSAEYVNRGRVRDYHKKQEGYEPEVNDRIPWREPEVATVNA